MDLKHWLASATTKLTQAGITTARLDCLVLLEDALGKDRSWLLAHPECICQGRTLTYLYGVVERRAQHEPLAYIRGKSEFYGREFLVDKRVLVPRPESETMIELLKEHVRSEKLEVRRKYQIVDVGTGSGALAVTAKLELPEAQVIAIDIDPECLKVARRNAKKLGANVTFLQSNLLEPALSTFDFRLSTILANLPYVPNDYPINNAATHEPKHALYGGQDGLDLYRQLFKQIATMSQKPLYILTESLPSQHKALAQIAKFTNYKLTKTTDLIQLFEYNM